ncbi:uncharacterized protein FTOL_05747 [Fusarium torulosum]|uniref:Uncharacterized protein n=1 Tax=Fusarium torulosum TaxID=33205 RepID=A0AAE8M7T1_9HYPO|nr:uncharacterized protein FTOL_05747 [Fusarium torulosum]
MELMVQQIHKELRLTSSLVQKVQVGQPANLSLEGSPSIAQSQVQYVQFRIDAIPWIKVTTPNSFAIIAEVSKQWDYLFVEVTRNEVESIQDSDRARFAIWKNCSRWDGLGIWELPQSTGEMDQIQRLIDQRRRRWGLIRSGLAESQWAVRELDKSLVLLEDLPKHSAFTAPVWGLPAVYLPKWPTSKQRDVEPFDFGFAYMSVRIQWLRTLGLLLKERSLKYKDFPDEMLEDVGEILGAPPGLLEHVTVYRHVTMPITLEAAFLGPHSIHCLTTLLVRNSHWLSEVTSWLEQVDPTIFAWGMARDAPLSFRTAFRTLRVAGVAPEELKELETALEVARSKVAELM